MWLLVYVLKAALYKLLVNLETFYWILKHLKYTINLSYGILKVYVVNRFLAHINTCLEQVIGFYYY